MKPKDIDQPNSKNRTQKERESIKLTKAIEGVLPRAYIQSNNVRKMSSLMTQAGHLMPSKTCLFLSNHIHDAQGSPLLGSSMALKLTSQHSNSPNTKFDSFSDLSVEWTLICFLSPCMPSCILYQQMKLSCIRLCRLVMVSNQVLFLASFILLK